MLAVCCRAHDACICIRFVRGACRTWPWPWRLLLDLAGCLDQIETCCALSVQVYKGRWHSSDVAIKIITVRTPEELPKMLREAEVMMKLDHTNVVRAFHASVWNPTEQVRIARVLALLDNGIGRRIRARWGC